MEDNKSILAEENKEVKKHKKEKKYKKHKKNSKLLNFLIIILYPILKLIFPAKYYQVENFDKERQQIVVCNHLEFIDPCPIIIKFFRKNANYLIKREIVFKNAFFNWFFHFSGAIPIVREELDMPAIKKVLTVLKHNESILIFPEGTRNKGEDYRTMLDFKDGAAWFALKANIPITPMILLKRTKLFKRSHIIVGKPIETEEFLNMPINEAKSILTQRMYEQMVDLRLKLEEIKKPKKEKKEIDK